MPRRPAAYLCVKEGRAAINGNQRQSVAINGNDESTAINGHQRQSAAYEIVDWTAPIRTSRM